MSQAHDTVLVESVGILCGQRYEEVSVVFWFVVSAVIIGSAFTQSHDSGMLALCGVGFLWFLFGLGD